MVTAMSKDNLMSSSPFCHTVNNKQVKYGETIPKWLLLELKVVQVT